MAAKGKYVVRVYKANSSVFVGYISKFNVPKRQFEVQMELYKAKRFNTKKAQAVSATIMDEFDKLEANPSYVDPGFRG